MFIVKIYQADKIAFQIDVFNKTFCIHEFIYDFFKFKWWLHVGIIDF